MRGDNIKAHIEREKMKQKAIEKMTMLVEKYVKHYKSDFYDHDLKNIEANKNYIWILRDSGTWMFEKEKASTIYSYCLDHDESVIAFYEVDTRTGKVEKIVNPAPLQKFEVIYKNSNNVFMNRKLHIDAWDKGKCEMLARDYMPEEYDHFQIIA